MDEHELEVYFHEYCGKCEYKDVTEEKDPCHLCLSYPHNTDSHKPVMYKGDYLAPEAAGIFKRLRKIKPYLYEAEYDFLDYDFAKEYYQRNEGAVSLGGCSSVRCGNFYGRNLDWLYNESAEFIIHRTRSGLRYRSIGVAGGLSALTDDFVSSGQPSHLYRILPFQIYDGINECGVFANMNVVPCDKDNNVSIPYIEEREKIAGTMLVRYILDNYSSAHQAVNNIARYISVYFQKALTDMGYQLHYMVGDKYGTYILEFVENRAVIIEVTDNFPVMTNFFRDGVALDHRGLVLTPETQHDSLNAMTFNGVTKYGSGLERHNLIVANYDEGFTKYGMRQLLNSIIYTRAYITSQNPSAPYWYTEFVGGDITAGTPASEYSEIVAKAGRAYLDRSRTDGGKTWHTVHSSVYDLNARRLYIVTQEDGEEFCFDLNY